jgi:hypothetical protein
MTLIWVRQTNQPGLGDFIRICPTILSLSLKENQPIPVFFDNKEMESIFENCSFIDILKEKPQNICNFSTTIILNKNIKYGKTQNKYYGVHFTIHKNENMFPFYIGSQIPYKDKLHKTVAVFNGIGLPRMYRYGKDIGDNNRNHILKSLRERGYKIILLGTEDDRKRFWSNIDTSECINMLGKTKLFEAVRIINDCDFFISNDTGLYHFASGLNKKGLVFWRETSYYIDGNPFDKDYIHHHQNEDITTYKTVIDRFLDKQSNK